MLSQLSINLGKSCPLCFPPLLSRCCPTSASTWKRAVLFAFPLCCVNAVLAQHQLGKELSSLLSLRVVSMLSQLSINLGKSCPLCFPLVLCQCCPSSSINLGKSCPLCFPLVLCQCCPSSASTWERAVLFAFPSYCVDAVLAQHQLGKELSSLLSPGVVLMLPQLSINLGKSCPLCFPLVLCRCCPSSASTWERAVLFAFPVLCRCCPSSASTWERAVLFAPSCCVDAVLAQYQLGKELSSLLSPCVVSMLSQLSINLGKSCPLCFPLVLCPCFPSSASTWERAVLFAFPVLCRCCPSSASTWERAVLFAFPLCCVHAFLAQHQLGKELSSLLSPCCVDAVLAQHQLRKELSSLLSPHVGSMLSQLSINLGKSCPLCFPLVLCRCCPSSASTWERAVLFAFPSCCVNAVLAQHQLGKELSSLLSPHVGSMLSQLNINLGKSCPLCFPLMLGQCCPSSASTWERAVLFAFPSCCVDAVLAQHQLGKELSSLLSPHVVSMLSQLSINLGESCPLCFPLMLCRCCPTSASTWERAVLFAFPSCCVNAVLAQHQLWKELPSLLSPRVVLMLSQLSINLGKSCPLCFPLVLCQCCPSSASTWERAVLFAFPSCCVNVVLAQHQLGKELFSLLSPHVVSMLSQLSINLGKSCPLCFPLMLCQCCPSSASTWERAVLFAFPSCCVNAVLGICVPFPAA